jgi:DNA-binding NarL/FixJ family response regulator
MRNTRTRVIIVDGHSLILDAVRCLLDATQDMILVGAATTPAQGYKLACEVEPDVAVVEMSQIYFEGYTLAQRIVREVAANVVALSENEQRGCVQRALDIGVKAYVSKWSPSTQLIQAIRAAADGGVYIDPAVVAAFSARRSTSPSVEGKPGAALTRREADVVRLIALGYTAKEIGGLLGIAIKSVATYKARACQKLDLTSRPQLVQFALAQGWIPQPEARPRRLTDIL